MEQLYLLQRFHYDTQTGDLIWKAKTVNDRWDKIWNSRFAGKRAGSIKQQNTYKCIDVRLDGKKYLAHRLIWYMMTGKWPFAIDHIDHDATNNRWRNLREATNSQNQWNKCRQVNNISGFKGVYFHNAANRWCAFIKHNNKKCYLGLFDTAEAAHTAYCTAARNLHGNFACTGDSCEKT
jgi:hypothetical protein